MKFSHFEVIRLGTMVRFVCYADWDKVGGQRIEFTLNVDSKPQAEMYEALFQRMAACTMLHEDMTDEALQASLNLTKGQDSEHG